MTGIAEVAQVVFVRKRLVEVKYLFLERRFPGSRRKAYYLMSIHEHLPPQARRDLKEVGWTKGVELAKRARRDGRHFDCATWLHKARQMPKEDFKQEVEKELTGRETELGDYLLQTAPEPDAAHRAGDRDGGSDAGKRPIPRLLFGNDLCRLPCRCQPGQRRSSDVVILDDEVLQISARRAKACISCRPE